MAIQFFLLVLVLLALLANTTASTCHRESKEFTVQVNESALDKSGCYLSSQGQACKTLEYLMTQNLADILKTLGNAKLIVNVTYNQTIGNSFQVSLPPSKCIKEISIVGSDKAFINFKNASISIRITQQEAKEVGNGYCWSWVGLGFAFVDQPNELDNLFLPEINMQVSYNLKIFNCEFVSVSLSSELSRGVAINSNVFGNGFCPILNLDLINSTVIANNTFENCQHNFVTVFEYAVLDIVVQNCSIEISNNLFSNVTDSLYRPAISIRGGSAGIIIQGNQFIGNTMSFIVIDTYVYKLSLVGNPCTWCSVLENKYQHNHYPPTAQEPILVKVVVDIVNSTCPMKTLLHQNSFENNTSTRLLHTEVKSKYMQYVTVTSLAVLNNSGTSPLVTLKKHEGNISVILGSLSVERNIGLYKKDNSESLERTIVYVKNANQSIIRDSTFQNNLGTPLVFENEQFRNDLCAMRNLSFKANTGVYGGAMSLYNVTFNSSCKSKILFEKNYAVYGGALYLKDSPSLCVCPGKCLTTLEFLDNRATTAGNSVYFASSSQFECQNFSMKDVGSAASSIVLHSGDLRIFPGQNIIINISITDQFDQPSLCTTDVSLYCEGQLYTCFDQDIKLSGPDSVVLVQLPNTESSVIDTNLRLQSYKHNDALDTSLNLACKNSNASIKIGLKIYGNCSQGFFYNSTLNVCKCAIKTKHKLYVCSTVLGAACVSHGYWYGRVSNEYVIARCKYSECKMDNAPCPSGIQSGSNYFLLNGTQCSKRRGGVLCRTCAEHFVFSFLSIHCIPEENCTSSKAIAILLSAILFQILITISLIFVVRFKHSLGCGFLYGPMLFLAMVNHIPLDDYSEYSTLSSAVSITSSVALLNLELFGRIPWCFFVSIPKLYNYSLRVLGPLTVLLVLLGITALVRWYPKCSVFEKMRLQLPQNFFQRWHASHWLASPLKAICILMMLSFWSLADISINILTPTVLDTQHYSMYMVSIQPDVTYFSHNEHLPLAIPALLVLLVVILPLVIILLSAPFLQRVINLIKIKPFLDEFQSCYKDKYRWYSGVYFVVWIAIVGIQGLPDSMLYTQTLFFILLCAQFLIKPYKSKLLNITDTLLLVDLNFLIALLYNKINEPLLTHTFSSLLIHALIIVPFACAVLFLIYLIFVKYGVYGCIKGFLSRRKRELELQQPQEVEHVSYPKVPVQEVHVPDDSSGLREPLIAIVDYR